MNSSPAQQLSNSALLKKQATALMTSPYTNLHSIGHALYDDAIAQEKQERKEAFEEKKFDREANLAESKDFRQDIRDQYQLSLDRNLIYDQMENLSEKDLAGPFAASLAKRFDIPISMLSNPDSETYEKLSQTLTRGVSQAYRGKILQSEFESFAKQIPTLMNSKDGRKRIVKVMRMLDKPSELRFKTYRDIVRKNNGRVPFDIQDQVIEKTEPLIEKESEKFKQSLINTAPSQQQMIEFLQKAEGATKEEKIKNAKRLAREQGYVVE
jgi:hypothetical protein